MLRNTFLVFISNVILCNRTKFFILQTFFLLQLYLQPVLVKRNFLPLFQCFLFFCSWIFFYWSEYMFCHAYNALIFFVFDKISILKISRIFSEKLKFSLKSIFQCFFVRNSLFRGFVWVGALCFCVST